MYVEERHLFGQAYLVAHHFRAHFSAYYVRAQFEYTVYRSKIKEELYRPPVLYLEEEQMPEQINIDAQILHECVVMAPPVDAVTRVGDQGEGGGGIIFLK